MHIETAFAKINLALHVRRRRGDGYHELETVFAFVDAGDQLTVEPAERDRLTITGEFGGSLTNASDNIIMQTLSSLPRAEGMHVILEKNLPVAAGLGGGSADAAALFRIVERQRGLPEDWRARAAKLGADVPACVRSLTIAGYGAGTELAEIENDLSGTPILLVNPRIALSTGQVFQNWGGDDQGPLPAGSARDIALFGRNDLEYSAVALVPEILDIVETIRASGAFVARMSGSGASCFGLYTDTGALTAAQAAIARKRPDWWQLAGRLR